MKQAQVFSTSYELPEKIWVGIGTYYVSQDGGNVKLRYLNQPGFGISEDVVRVYPDAPFVDASQNEPVIVFFRKGKSGSKAIAVTSLRKEPGLCASILEAAAHQQNFMITIERYGEHVLAEIDRVLQTYLTDPRFIRKDNKLILDVDDGFITVKVKKGASRDISSKYPSQFLFVDDETLGIRGLR